MKKNASGMPLFAIRISLIETCC